MKTPPPKWFKIDDWHLNILGVVDASEIGIYIIMLSFLAYMTKTFLYKLEFWRYFHISTFYICAYIVILSRIAMLGILIHKVVVLHPVKHWVSNKDWFVCWAMDSVSTYTRIFMGII